LAYDLINKIFEIEADIAGVSGSQFQNQQQQYQEFILV
jgi:hypothetical protein